MSEKCPIFKATKRKAIKSECHSCPINDSFPETIIDEAEEISMEAWGKAMVKIRKVVGEYIERETKK